MAKNLETGPGPHTDLVGGGHIVGCDIRCRVERQVDGVWTTVHQSFYYPERSYLVFAILAGVRTCTVGPVVPVAEPRGLPPDLDPHRNPKLGTWAEDHDDLHTRTWLLLSELLAYPWSQAIDQRDGHRGDQTSFFIKHLPRLQELDPDPTKVRLVMGFDS